MGARTMRRTPRSWPPIAQTAAAIVAVAGLVLPAAASAGSQPSNDLGGSTIVYGSVNSQLLAFSRCMRSDGVPNFPDPQPDAVRTKFPSPAQLGVSNSRYQAALKDCQQLLPPGNGDQFPPAEVQLVLAGMLRFSECMREHGVRNWPDPILDSQGRPVFDLGRAGISRSESRSAQITSRIAECHHLLPRALPGIPVGGS